MQMVCLCLSKKSYKPDNDLVHILSEDIQRTQKANFGWSVKERWIPRKKCILKCILKILVSSLGSLVL